MRYAILEKRLPTTNFQPIPISHLNHAEFRLNFNRLCYYERATQRGELLLYTHEDTQRIIDYWQRLCPKAEYMLFGDHTSAGHGCRQLKG